ncbi:unnamed protein product [Amoebophrya sp. A120]|nr:unnamed protein product [Amoebophrya sp. A120]|eukprot:GSA120T00003086001.1
MSDPEATAEQPAPTLLEEGAKEAEAADAAEKQADDAGADGEAAGAEEAAVEASPEGGAEGEPAAQEAAAPAEETTGAADATEGATEGVPAGDETAPAASSKPPTPENNAAGEDEAAVQPKPSPKSPLGGSARSLRSLSSMKLPGPLDILVGSDGEEYDAPVPDSVRLKAPLAELDYDPFADYDDRAELYHFYKYEIRNKYTFAPFELSDFARGFHLVDTLGEGLLTPPQVARAMEHIGQGQDAEEMEWAVNQSDPEGVGLWDFQRFLDMMALFRKPPLTEVELRETFDLMDRDGGGSISANELRLLMKGVGNAMTADEAEEMLEIADADGSGEIEFEEFAHEVLSSQT